MRKFVIRGTCFSVIGIALLFAVNALYIRTNGYKSKDETFRYFLMPRNIQVANFGSSHGAYGFDYSGIEGITGFNFGLPGQNPHYDLKVLQQYSERLAEGCVVIIPISYFTFDQQRDSDNLRRMYYRIIDYGSIYNHKITEYLRLGLLPILSASFNAKFIIKDKKDISFNLYWLYDYMRIHYTENDIEGFKQNAQGHLDYCRRITDEGENEEYNTKCLEEMIELCREKGFRPVLITMPFTKYYNDMFSEEFYADFHAKIDRLCEKYAVPYYDYSRDPRITDNLRLFIDSNHLNYEGSATFTRMILSDLGLI